MSLVTGNEAARRQRQGTGQGAYTLRDLLIVASYHRRVMIAVFLVTVVGACVAAWFSPIRYEAEARLLVLFNAEQSGNQDLVERPSILSIDGLRATESEVDILRSRTLIREMVRKVGVQTLFPHLDGEGPLGFGKGEPEDQLVERATDLAEARFRITAQSGSNLVLVAFSHQDRAVAIRAVDELIRAYLARRGSIYANPRSPFLEQEAEKFRLQIDQLQRNLADAKAALKKSLGRATDVTSTELNRYRLKAAIAKVASIKSACVDTDAADADCKTELEEKIKELTGKDVDE